MTTTLTCEEVIENAERLTPEQQRLVIEHLTAHLRADAGSGEPRPRWEDLYGTAPYPMCGEDAQAWVSRTRRESDEARRVR